MECQFCKKIFSNKSNLRNHQATAKYCLKLQGRKNEENKFKCNDCKKICKVVIEAYFEATSEYSFE